MTKKQSIFIKKNLIILFLLLSFSAIGQRKVFPGIRSGVNWTRISTLGLDSKFDFYISGFAEFRFGRVYILQPEISYLRQGAKDNIRLGKNIYDIEIDQLNYASFGLISKFNVANNVRLYVGPSVEYLLNTNSLVDSRIDVTQSLGAEYKFYNGFGVELRVKNGFIPVYSRVYANGNYSTEDCKNHGLQMGINYTF